MKYVRPQALECEACVMFGLVIWLNASVPLC